MVHGGCRAANYRALSFFSSSASSALSRNSSTFALAAIHLPALLKMVKALTFKGDKKVTKKRKRTDPGSGEPDADLTAGSREASNIEDDNTWVAPDGASDLTGPVIFILPTTPSSAIACDANGKIFASELETLVEEDPSTAEPHDVRQVWVANRVAGSDNLTLKGHHGRYLGCDKFGILSATKEAVSPEESFLCLAAPSQLGMFILQTQRETFLTVGTEEDPSHAKIRGDAEAITFNTTFRVKMQARFKPRLKVTKEEKAREKISRKELEIAAGRRLEDEEVKQLKKARREGNYHEAMLNVKVKGKHDKFA